MIYIYPANRMEDLLTLFDKVQQSSHLAPLAQEVVLVQNPGMQHWLNMQQAQISGISMNASFVLPAQFLWQQLKVLSGQQDSDQTPYSREVLAWRIDKILQSNAMLSHPDCEPANRYWQTAEQQDPLKRFQLAVQVADLFEQYLIYRPEWINDWASAEQSADFDSQSITHAKWQGVIWQLLTADIPYDPNELMALAKTNLQHNKHLLPERISIFGINTLAPMWVDFLGLISTVTDVHFYHLNPCIEYWGDIQTDKSKSKQAYLAQVNKWPDDGTQEESVNPLLANLGQQGKAFLTQLHGLNNIEIPLYDLIFEQESSQSSVKPTALMQLQKDILTLTDRRQQPSTLIDSSITITSGHSALREVQGLHDYLLHLFNQDPTLTPKDVLVMCPQIEQYAPYIDSVFVRGWDDLSESVPPLPCSIADRVSKDSEPLVVAFSELLNLPDARFQISSILSYLRLLPLQMRFDLTESDVELLTDWLQKANVHWGLNAEHKNSLLNIDNASAQYTWQQGLNRLLQGFAYGDHLALFEDDMVLPWVEGTDGVLLGKLLLLCQQLEQMRADMMSPKTPAKWQSCLQEFVDNLFAEQEYSQGLMIIQQAIDSLHEYCEQADYRDEIELSVVRDFLNHHFSQPDPGRQFMIGQITFCSMLPMRSIPFKTIAILGLNDGDFPRQRQPMGFDLMAMTAAKMGDRSRKNDDRYLFLEALISARQHLYLSYQGHDVKNNNERQPSIVLRELMEYLTTAYNWNFTGDKQLRQLPLQVFAADNFLLSNRYQSFDQKWLNLLQTSRLTALSDDHNNDSSQAVLSGKDETLEHGEYTNLSLKELVQFFLHPSKYFARARLKLYFDQDLDVVSDTEPFQPDHLNKYLFKRDILECLTEAEQHEQAEKDRKTAKSEQLARIQTMAIRSGQFPDNPDTKDNLAQWQSLIEDFATTVNQQRHVLTQDMSELNAHISTLVTLDDQNSNEAIEITLEQGVSFFEADTALCLIKNRHAKAKGKDLFDLYCHHLLLCVFAKEQHAITSVTSVGYYLDEKAHKLHAYRFDYLANAKDILQHMLALFVRGQDTPLLLNSELAHHLFWDKKGAIEPEFSQQELRKVWQDGFSTKGLGSDPYLQYFWPQLPELKEYADALQKVYQPLYQAVQYVESGLLTQVESCTEPKNNLAQTTASLKDEN
ncbi:exodeoxyribonuclease V subunit gamma [Thalassotalea aquiviva]|uniref:exodeoxyribonuclease V subunit gamma n=1 Tax=Thalassotalea aquiviva TaxID=3242415 RepID=UPI00352AA343